jgi:branched-chain amino acid transport system permease protein
MLRSLLRPQPIALAIVIALLALVPLVGERWIIDLFTEILIFALFALALNLMGGFGGLISFGHAAYFAIGAYSVAIFGTTYQWPFAAVFGAVVVLSAVTAGIIGFFSVRLSSIFFSMLTLAFAQFIWAIAHEWHSVTKGDNGYLNLARPEFVLSRPSLFYFVLVTVIVATAVLWVIVHSPFGRILISTRENPLRAEFMGVDVKRIQIIAFMISGTFSGIAGGLLALLNRSVFPTAAWWTESAEVLIMTILGGMHSFFGPAVGAAVVLILEREITQHTQYWPTVLGVILLVVLFAFPDGLAGLTKLTRFLPGRRRG